MHAEHEVDFVVVGSGVGGLTAAVTAADAGLRVLIVERAATLGGVTAASGGMVWIPLTRYGMAANPDDTPEAANSYLEFVAAGYGSPAHRARFVQAGPEAVHYLADHAGVRWILIDGHVDNFDPWAPGSVRNCRALEVEPFEGADLGEWQNKTLRSPFFAGLTAGEGLDPSALTEPLADLLARRAAGDYRTGGGGLIAYLIKAALIDRQIPVLTETRADSLIVEDDAVLGLRADTAAGERILVRSSRGVLLATGGYDWNTTNQLESIPTFGSSCPPTVTGDHLVMAGEIGAAITVLPPIGFHTQLGYHIPGEEFEGAPLWRWAMYEAGARHAVLVNDTAKRFCDESWFYHQQSILREFDPARRRYTNLPAYLIFDQNHRNQTPLGPFLPGEELPNDPFVRADTITGLADRLGLDPGQLAKTVTTFNDYCTQGSDPDFGRGEKEFMSFLRPGAPGINPSLGPVERGPFYGVKLDIGGLGANSAGLHTDDHAVVQHLRGRPITGLYAVGNAAAHLDMGPAYISGGLISRGLVWGYVAARHAAARRAGVLHGSSARPAD